MLDINCQIGQCIQEKAILNYKALMKKHEEVDLLFVKVEEVGQQNFPRKTGNQIPVEMV
jgi:hypothetical protein